MGAAVWQPITDVESFARSALTRTQANAQGAV
jgi:hypothetical protein